MPEDQAKKAKQTMKIPKDDEAKAKSSIVMIVVAVVSFIVIFAGYNFLQNQQGANKTPYSDLVKDMQDEKISQIEVCDLTLKATYKDGAVKNADTTIPNFDQYVFAKQGLDLDPSKLSVKVCAPSPNFDAIFNILLNIVLLVGLALIGYMVIKSMNNSGSKLFSFGQSKARLSFGRKQDVSFKDVAGINEAKEELNEIVLFLKDPKRFLKLGARIPKGVLMVGAPGTGKTLLARAIAGEASVPFFHTSGAEFEEMLVGAGASRVRDLFSKAKRAAPSLIFIDEIDAVGRKRGTTIQSSTTEQTLNQILTEMDGFEKNQNVIVIGATNRPDVLDPALLRPGRFDRKITLDLPDVEGRTDILKIHSKNKPLAQDVKLENVAKRTVGFSGADLENILNEAAIMAAKANRKEVTQNDIEESTLKVVMGLARKRKRTDKEIKTVAYHESGHAVVSKFVPEADPVHKITIVSRGMSGGMTMHMPEDDENLTTKTKFLSEIKILLAGYISEMTFMGDVTTGASNDIDHATEIAKRMVKRFGMSEKLGLIRYDVGDENEYLGYSYSEKEHSDATSKVIDDEVSKIIQNCYDETQRIISEHKNKIEELKNILLKKEVVDREEFDALFV